MAVGVAMGVLLAVEFEFGIGVFVGPGSHKKTLLHLCFGSGSRLSLYQLQSA